MLDPLTILVKELRLQSCFTYVDELTEVISLLTGVLRRLCRDHRRDSGTLASDLGQRSVHLTLVFSAYASRFVPSELRFTEP